MCGSAAKGILKKMVLLGLLKAESVNKCDAAIFIYVNHLNSLFAGSGFYNLY